jgi:hypothetical protein
VAIHLRLVGECDADGKWHQLGYEKSSTHAQAGPGKFVYHARTYPPAEANLPQLLK